MAGDCLPLPLPPANPERLKFVCGLVLLRLVESLETGVWEPDAESCRTGNNNCVLVPEGKESVGCGKESFGKIFTGVEGVVESGGIGGIRGFVESWENVLTEYISIIHTIKILHMGIFILIKRNQKFKECA
jgi:hypothetical protein